MTIETLDEFLVGSPPIDPAILSREIERARGELPLAALRDACGITQTEMAKRLDKSQAAVSKFEGRGDFLMSTLYRYANAVGARIDLRILANGRCFELTGNENEDVLTFSLTEPLCADRIGERIAGNVVQLKQMARIRAGKERPQAGSVIWAQRCGDAAPVGVETIFTATNEYEKTSASA